MWEKFGPIDIQNHAQNFGKLDEADPIQAINSPNYFYKGQVKVFKQKTKSELNYYGGAFPHSKLRPHGIGRLIYCGT